VPDCGAELDPNLIRGDPVLLSDQRGRRAWSSN
jgi:hypothetical protein